MDKTTSVAHVSIADYQPVEVSDLTAKLESRGDFVEHNPSTYHSEVDIEYRTIFHQTFRHVRQNAVTGLKAG